MYSTEGGMDIEAVAEKTPELILEKKLIQPLDFKAFKLEMWLLIWVSAEWHLKEW